MRCRARYLQEYRHENIPFTIAGLYRYADNAVLRSLLQEAGDAQRYSTNSCRCNSALSGDTAQYGKALHNGMLLAQDEINATAQSSSEARLSLHFEDSQGNASIGVNAFHKLVDFNKTPLVLGAMFSKVTMAIAPIAEEQHIVLLSPTSSDVALTNAGDYIFRIYPSDTYDGAYLAQYLARQPGIRRVAVLYLTTSSTTAIAQVFRDSFTKAGGTVVMMDGHAEQTKDFRTVLEKVNHAHPDIVLLCSYLNEMALILRQGAELGYKLRYAAISTIYDKKIFALAGDAAEGVVFSTAKYDANSDDPPIKSFVSAFRERFGQEPTFGQPTATTQCASRQPRFAGVRRNGRRDKNRPVQYR